MYRKHPSNNRLRVALVSSCAAAALLCAAGTASAAVMYLENFNDSTLETGTSTLNATIDGGIASFTDASTTQRARFVVLSNAFNEPVMTFSFDVVAPVTAAEGLDNELLLRAGIGTANNTLSSAEAILEAVVWRSSGGGTGGGSRGDFANNGNESIFVVVNNKATDLVFASPIDGTDVTLAAFQYIPYVRNNQTGVYGTLKGISDLTDRNADEEGVGTFVRFGIGNSSNTHQGTFALDNVRVDNDVFLGPIPEPASLSLLAGLSALALLRRRS